MSDDEHSPVLGIDLGTTYSCIARWDGRREEPDVYTLGPGDRTLPSVAYYPEKGDILVGKLAKNRLLMDPENGVEKVKRHIGEEGFALDIRGQKRSPVDVSADILSKLVGDVRGKYPTGKWEHAGAVVTHPYYFKYPQVANTEAAAKQAGINVFRLIPEPIAAALDYGLQEGRFKEDSSAPETILIFDLGGGTFDVTVFRMTNEKDRLLFEVLSTGGDDRLGGTDFDEALVDHGLAEAGIDLCAVDDSTRLKSLAKLNEAAINAKHELSAIESSFLLVPDVIPGQHLELEIERQQFEKILAEPPEPGAHWSSPTPRGDFLERIRTIVDETVYKSGLKKGDIGRTIMIGGSSKMPVMGRIVKELTGAEPWATAEQDLAVARGAAIIAAMDDGRMESLAGGKEIVIEVPTSHALGIRTAGGIFTKLIPENRKTPCDATQIFEKKGRQTVLNVEVFQGSGKNVTDSGVAKVGVVPITGLPADSDFEIKVTFKVNIQQMVSVRVEWPGGFTEENLKLKQ